MKLPIEALSVAPGVTLYHKGPPLDLGPLPSFFYFSLAGEDSLCLDPFNQPVQFLEGKMIRVFSMTLPGHENRLPATGAMKVWADDFSHNRDPISDFLDTFEQALSFTIDNRFASKEKMGVGGLSRGGFIALHIAARHENIKYALAFAPLTELHKIKEFSHLQNNPRVRAFDLVHQSKALARTHIRIHMGNHDSLVGTKEAFTFTMSVVDAAIQEGIRCPQVEFLLHPSIGHKGHGTPPEIFREGAHWMAECLTSSS